MINRSQIVLLLVLFGFGHGQSKYTAGLSLKSIQTDILSLVFINGISMYSDVDVFTQTSPDASSYGVRMGGEAIHLFGLVHQNDQYPIRNLYIALRASSNKIFHINASLAYVNAHTFAGRPGKGDGDFLRVGMEASRYFLGNTLGIKIKLNYPIYTFTGRGHGFIGFGIVAGLLNY